MFITLKDIHLLVTFLNDKRHRQESFHSTVFSNILLIEMAIIRMYCIVKENNSTF